MQIIVVMKTRTGEKESSKKKVDLITDIFTERDITAETATRYIWEFFLSEKLWKIEKEQTNF